MGAHRSRFSRKIAIAVGVAVIFGSMAAGVALANGSGHGSTPAVVVDDQSPSPGQSADDHNGQGKQEPGDDHDTSASPGASCGQDADDVDGATPRPSTSEHESDDSKGWRDTTADLVGA